MSVKVNQARAKSTVQTVFGGMQTQGNPALQKAWVKIQESDYLAAAHLLESAGRDMRVRNAMGVCLMRLGKVDQAVDLFRAFVLMPGSLIERPDVSHAYKRNFATALLMKGYPSGALSVLAATHDREHPMAVRLYAAINQWDKSLSWFRRLEWRLNDCVPLACRIPLDFEPGEFDIGVPGSRPVVDVKPPKAA